MNGKWYIFYHRQTNRNQFSRQACAEEIFFDNDGKIAQVEMTSCGLNEGPLPGSGTYPAYIACNLQSKNGALLYGLGDRPIDASHPYFTQDGEDRETEPGQYIANMTDGSVAGFKYFSLEKAERISIKVRGTGEGYMEFSIKGK